MENLFAALDHPDSIAFLISVLISFLIGFVTAWILWGGRARKASKKADSLQQELSALRTEHHSLKEEIDLKEADILRVYREAEKSLEYARGVDARKAKWQSELEETKIEFAKLQDTNRSYATTIDDLNHQILGLKSRLASMSNEAGTADSSGKATSKSAPHPSERVITLEKRLLALDAENQALRSELSQMRNMKITETPAKTERVPTVKPPLVHEKKEEAKPKSPTETLPQKKKQEKDDLTRIKGIGSVLEAKLNDIGIFTYEQIKSFDEEKAEKVNEQIGFFPGRILRDDWVGQAARLHQMKMENPDALKPTAIFPKNPGDLKIIEGIGPKIEKLLKKAGVNTLQDLAATEVKNIQEILDAAGDAYRIHDPGTWPEQAAMAAAGNWEKLKEFQDYLLGGRYEV